MTTPPQAPELAALLIEDDALDAAAFRRALPSIRVHWVRTLRDGVDAAADDYDVIALDLGLPDSDGVDTVRAVAEVVAGRAPLVVLTGSDDSSLGPALLEAGAGHVLDKHAVDRLTLADTIEGIVTTFRAASGVSDRGEHPPGSAP